MKIEIHPVLKDVLPDLKTDEYEKLQASIRKHGVKDAIELWKQGDVYYILDGHNRYNICTTNKPEIKFEIRVVNDVKTVSDAILYIITNQLARRNMSKAERCFTAIKHRELVENRAKQNLKTKTTGKPLTKDERQKVHTHEVLSNIAGTSPTTMQRFMYIYDNKDWLTQDELVKFKTEKLSIASAKNMIKERIKQKDGEEEGTRWNDHYDKLYQRRMTAYFKPVFINKTFMQALSDEDIIENSLSAIVCDPPYGYYRDEIGGPRLDWLPQYKDLGEFCSKALLPGRTAFILTGQYSLDVIIRNLLLNKEDEANRLIYKNELQWRWIIPYLMYGGGSKSDSIKRKVDRITWKPFLCFSKGEPITRISRDSIESTVVFAGEPPDKKVYEWIQSLYGFVQLINTYSKKGDLICDPTSGMATTAVACMLTDRRFIGIESNALRVKKSKEILGDNDKGLSDLKIKIQNDSYVLQLPTYKIEKDDVKRFQEIFEQLGEIPQVMPKVNVEITPGLKKTSKKQNPLQPPPYEPASKIEPLKPKIKTCLGCRYMKPSKLALTGLRCMKHGKNVDDLSTPACKQWFG